MTRNFTSLILFLFVTISGCMQIDTPVYVAHPGGSRYHKHNCRYIEKDVVKIAMLKAIENGYEPCSSCKPPVPPYRPEMPADAAVVLPVQDPINDRVVDEVEQEINHSALVQCTGITKSGKQCKRKIKDPGRRCFQHRDQ
jgi:hypothetical protein